MGKEDYEHASQKSAKTSSLFGHMASCFEVGSIGATFVVGWLAVEPLSASVFALAGVATSSLLRKWSESKASEAVTNESDALAAELLKEIRLIRSTISLVLLLGVAYFLSYLARTALVDGIFISVGMIALLVASLSLLWPNQSKELYHRFIGENMGRKYYRFRR